MEIVRRIAWRVGIFTELELTKDLSIGEGLFTGNIHHGGVFHRVSSPKEIFCGSNFL